MIDGAMLIDKIEKLSLKPGDIVMATAPDEMLEDGRTLVEIMRDCLVHVIPRGTALMVMPDGWTAARCDHAAAEDLPEALTDADRRRWCPGCGSLCERGAWRCPKGAVKA